jgi:serine/threonine-protein kinase
MVDLTGKTLGNNQIIEEIGRGGMAVVYRAFQTSLNRFVAVKVLPAQLAMDRQFVDRFVREARAAASLRHPNIVVVHDVGEQDGLYFIVMEYLEGRTLQELIQQEGPLLPERTARILEQTCAALDHAHQRGFVHRDVKPSNIFVGEGDRVTLTDFGIAKAAWEAHQLTQTGMLVGTPEYMSPEQAEGEEVDHRTDLYAMGVVLFQMLTGKVPFRRTTPHATLHAVIYEPPPSPRELNPALPPAMESVLLKAVAKQPEQRFQSGAEMGSALRAAVSGRTVMGAGPVTDARKKRSASPVIWLMAAVAAVLVVLLGAIGLLLAGEGKDATPVVATTEAIAAASVAPTETETSGTLATPTELTPSTTPEDGSETPQPTEPSASPTSTAEAATDTAQPPTETPIDTPEPPTSTPKPPTNTPKPPTFTPVPPTWTPSPPPGCPFDPQGAFSSLWNAYKSKLGCATYQNPKLINDAEQAFQNGHMFWRQDNDWAYVVYEQGPKNGTYQAFTDLWSEGDPDYSCAAPPPPAGHVQPVRGFGKVWCELGAQNAPIGWGKGEEAGFWGGNGDPMVQDFQYGMVFRDSDGTTKGLAYVFFFSDNSFVRVPY